MIDGDDGELNVSAFKHIDVLHYSSKQSLNSKNKAAPKHIHG